MASVKYNIVVLMDASKGQYRQTVLVYTVRLVILAVMSTLVFFGWSYLKERSTPIPNDILQSVDFPVYYPSEIPQGYRLDKQSIRNDSGIVFFTLQNISHKITFSQQAAPSTPPDLKRLTQGDNEFSQIDTPLGQAIQGTNNKTPVAILLTNTTLINLTATQRVPSDIISHLIKQLRSL